MTNLRTAIGILRAIATGQHTLERIARATGTCERTVKRALLDLEQFGVQTTAERLGRTKRRRNITHWGMFDPAAIRHYWTNHK